MARISSRLETIFPLIKTQITTATGLDTTLVFSSFWPAPLLVERSPTALFVVLKPKQFRVWEEVVTGGGNDTLWVDGDFSITIFSRFGSDVDWADDTRLFDTSSGIHTVWTNILHSVQLFDPVDGSGNQVCAEPIRLARDGWWYEGAEPMADWLRIVSNWELKFLHTV